MQMRINMPCRRNTAINLVARRLHQAKKHAFHVKLAISRVKTAMRTFSQGENARSKYRPAKLGAEPTATSRGKSAKVKTSRSRSQVRHIRQKVAGARVMPFIWRLLSKRSKTDKGNIGDAVVQTQKRSARVPAINLSMLLGLVSSTHASQDIAQRGHA